MSADQARLSVATQAALDGSGLEQSPASALVLATAAPGEAPHLALLSRAEVLAVSDQELRLALHADSGSSAALAASGCATLLAVEPALVETISLRVRGIEQVTVAGRLLACFLTEVTEVHSHTAPYATVTSGISFELTDPEPTLARWRETLDVLRGLEPA